MKKRKSKLRVILLAVAVVMLFSCMFAGCTPPAGPSDEWAVTLDFNDGASMPRTVYVDKEGGTVTEPKAPSMIGYTFTDWNTAQDGSGQTVTFPYTPTADVTFYAQWDARQYVITFDAGEGTFPGGGSTATVEASYGSVIPADKIPVPVRSETDPETGETIYTFREWRTAAGQSVDFATWTMPAEDTTLTAVYRSIYVRIVQLDLKMGDGYVQEFELEKGDDVRDREVVTAAGKRVTESGAHPGYKLAGWSTNPDAKPGDSDVVATRNLFPIEYDAITGGETKYYAVWEMEKYIATFQYNYKSAPELTYATVPDLTLVDAVTPPETDPTRPGYTFDGWYTQGYGGNLVDFTDLHLTAHGTYYAHWKSELVETDIFHAEYVDLTQQVKMPGYSGENSFTSVIVADDKNWGSTVDNNYKVDGVTQSAGIGYFVSYQYRYGATLTFNIHSDSDVSGATLYGAIAMEIFGGNVIGPDGNKKVAIYVNDVALNYAPIDFGESSTFVDVNWSSGIKENQFGNIDLVKGENVIKIVVENSTPPGSGGTMQATSFITDYLRIDTHGGAKLSWSPIYDNIG